ncbi:hypothetical protein Tco_1236837 [Tanacetum coccineum]
MSRAPNTSPVCSSGKVIEFWNPAWFRRECSCKVLGTGVMAGFIFPDDDAPSLKRFRPSMFKDSLGGCRRASFLHRSSHLSPNMVENIQTTSLEPGLESSSIFIPVSYLMVVPNQNINALTLCHLIEKEKLNGSNFHDLHKNLRITLKYEGKLHHIDSPFPDAPVVNVTLVQVMCGFA